MDDLIPAEGIPEMKSAGINKHAGARSRVRRSARLTRISRTAGRCARENRANRPDAGSPPPFDISRSPPHTTPVVFPGEAGRAFGNGSQSLASSDEVGADAYRTTARCLIDPMMLPGIERVGKAAGDRMPTFS